MLSPQAAGSEWVDKETTHWLEHRGRDHLVIVLAAGTLHWDETTARLDPEGSDAALPILTQPGILPTEPLFVDVSADGPWDIRNPTFRDKLASIAAPIHGKSKDQLIAGDDLREQRRFRRLRAAAITGLAIFAIAALVAALVAVGQRQEALQQRNTAIAVRLDAEAQGILAGSRPGGDVLAFGKLPAARTLNSPDDGALLHAIEQRTNTLKVVDIGAPVYGLAFTPVGHRLATGGEDNTARLWNGDTGQPIGDPLTGHIRAGCNRRGVQPGRATGSPAPAPTAPCGCGMPTPANPSA